MLIGAIKAWWHCLIRTLSKDDHREVRMYNLKHKLTYIGCMCGKRFWQRIRW